MIKYFSWNYHENYKRRTWAEHGLPIFCVSLHGNYMNNLLSYCGLIDAKIRASDKDLPVIQPKICFCKEDMILRLLSTFDF